jgi:isopenicillin N synthase-like dioxygenase
MSVIPPISLTLWETDFASFTRALGDSFARFGFAVVADHGLDQARVDDAMADAKAFFALPEAVKRNYQLAGSAGHRGYTPFAVETAKGAIHADLKEFWHLGGEAPAGQSDRGGVADNVWPSEIPRFQRSQLWLYEALEALGGKLLAAIAAYLELEAAYFEHATTKGGNLLRLLHYPPSGFDGPSIRAEAHEDIDAITLLLGAEEAGLEILERGGRWMAVNPPAGSVVVNVGDMLARLTNDVLPSTTHRVVNPPPERRGVARYSTPFFLQFRPDFLIATLPGCVRADRPNRYPAPIKAEEFLAQRLREIRLA